MIIITGRTTKNDITVTRIDNNRYRITVYCVKGAGGGELTPETLGSCIESSEDRGTPKDNDLLPITDSVNTHIAKKHTWATFISHISSALSSVFDVAGAGVAAVNSHLNSFTHSNIHSASGQFNQTISGEIDDLTGKTTLVDNDVFLIEDIESSGTPLKKKKVYWSSIKSSLSSIFAAAGHNHDSSYSAIDHNHNSLYAAVNHSHSCLIAIGINVDGQGGVITTGSKGFRVCESAGTIVNWFVVADAAGSIQYDIKRGGNSIIGAGNKPLLNSAQRNNAVPANWTSTAITANDELEFVIDSAATLTKATLFIHVNKTIS